MACYDDESDNDFTGPVNMGNPFEISMNDLASKILRLTNSNSNITFHKLPIDDPKMRKPDITLAKNKFNWIPSTDLNTGLIKTIKYFKKLNKLVTNNFSRW